MALTETIDDAKMGRPPKYPWHKWADGRRHTLQRGKDFDAELVSFRTMVHRKAREMSPFDQPRIRAKTKINWRHESVKIIFYREDEGEPKL